MPITEDGYEYIMPENIKQMIDREFCIQFREELYKIFNLSLEDFDVDSLLLLSGTEGWSTALGMVCIKTNKDELFKYYNKLEWYESDIFDGNLEDMMVDYHVILKGSMDDLISKELQLDQSEFAMCLHCGKRFLIKDMTVDKETDMYICGKCKRDIENKDNPDYIPNANDYYKNGLKIIKEKFSK